MHFEIYGDGEDFYIRPPSNPTALCWFYLEGSWSCERAGFPELAQKVEFGELPGDLQEEILAFAARSEVMGAQVWGMSN